MSTFFVPASRQSLDFYYYYLDNLRDSDSLRFTASTLCATGFVRALLHYDDVPAPSASSSSRRSYLDCPRICTQYPHPDVEPNAVCQRSKMPNVFDANLPPKQDSSERGAICVETLSHYTPESAPSTG